MSAYVVKQIDEMASIHGGIVKLAGAELGIESFGMQVLDFPARFEHYPEHDHSEDEHEEVYAVLRGSGDWIIDGDRVPVDPGTIVRIAPSSRRKLEPGPGGIRVLALGCSMGKLYERPKDFQLEAQT